MAEDRAKHEAAELIDVNDEAQCIRWSHELNISAGELKAAVHYAGSRVEDVRRYIRERTLPPLGRDPLGEKDLPGEK